MTPARRVSAEVLPAPGQDEARAIRADYEQSMSGLRAFVRMGFRLVAVKAALPHGQFLTWCDAYLPDLTPRHLQRAKRIAEGLADMAGIKCDPRVVFERADLPSEILALIDGKTGYKALLATVAEYRDDEAERQAEAQCQRLFAADPALRDEWESRVIAGEISWCQAVRGIAGQQSTAGKRRNDPDYERLVFSSLKTLHNGLSGHWDRLPADRRAELVVSLKTMAAEWPADLRHALAAAL
jgi:hypothetical protein